MSEISADCPEQFKTLLLKYNKVTNESIENIKEHINHKIVDLNIFGNKIDLLNFQEVSLFLRKFTPFNNILIGDIFWPTGQNICKWCFENNINCYFLQHGQWIFVNNKMNPKFLPSCTFLFGNKLKEEMLKWPYGKKSKIEVTGSPRYDNVKTEQGNYIYFSPPVLTEYNPSSINISHKKNFKFLSNLYGIDNHLNMIIHPHYREVNIDVLKKMFPKANFVEPKTRAIDIIAKSYKVLTHRNSTVVLDAIACQKNCVLVNFAGFDSFYPKNYFREFAIECNNISECIEVLKKECVINTKSTSDFIMLGNASKRISSIIEKGKTNVNDTNNCL